MHPIGPVLHGIAAATPPGVSERLFAPGCTALRGVFTRPSKGGRGRRGCVFILPLGLIDPGRFVSHRTAVGTPTHRLMGRPAVAPVIATNSSY